MGMLKNVFLRLDNLLSLLVIVTSCSIVLLDVFGVDLPIGTLEEAFLVILGLLAFNNIVERELRFGELKKELHELKEEISRFKRPLFVHQSELPSISQFMQVSDELFYTGGHLHSLVNNHTNLFDKWLRDGKSLKFLLQDPENKGLHELRMPCVNYSSKVYVAQIEDTINTLKKLKTKYPNSRLGLRVTDVTPTQSIAIYDGNKGGTQMCMLIHLPNGEAASGPFISINRSEGGEWFSLIFERYYDMLWNSSKVVIPHPED